MATTRSAGVSRKPVAGGYDVVIVGGAMVGSATAWFLAANPDFDGSVLVVDRDLTFADTSTARTNSCIRQQFSNPLNVQISQFGAQFIRNFRDELGGDPDIPDIGTDFFGYLYLASTGDQAERLRRNQARQSALGAATELLTAEQIKARYPFYRVDDVMCGSHNGRDEGYFDSGTVFDWLRRKARVNGVEYVEAEVTGLDVIDRQVTAVRLAGGITIGCSYLVDAAGPRAAVLAAMARIDLPVEARKRFSWVFQAADPPGMAVPLTVDPSGVHVRSDGKAFLAGCAPDPDPAVDFDDFAMDDDLFEGRVWPILAHRIPAFERIKVSTRWAGHYAYNTFDQNAVVGPHVEVENFLFANGFSGHGLQQAPAIGRGLSEWIAHGAYRALDLTPLGFRRIVDGVRFVEEAVI